MKTKSRYIIILGILFTYILLQFMWWEILLVKQNGRIINEEQKLIEITSTDRQKLQQDIEELHHRKKMQTVMIVGEGTVFLLFLLFGIAKIKQAMDKESLLNKQQNNFFLSITHELKTPIAATKLQLQTLQRPNLEAAIQSQLISQALLETERLNLLIDNVLLASSLDNGQLSFHPEASNLGEYITQIIKRYYNKELQNKEITLDLQEEVFADIDRHAFPSILTNLVGNAIKYTKEQAQIHIQLTNKNGKTTLTVKDQGIGISDEDKAKIFTRFYRAGNEETRSTKGTGLGLFIVKYILDNHKASITVKNNTPKGSIFEIQFNAV